MKSLKNAIIKFFCFLKIIKEVNNFVPSLCNCYTTKWGKFPVCFCTKESVIMTHHLGKGLVKNGE